MRHFVITIDGPAGTGKSTVAREVASRLGFVYLDTGALYRAAALAVDDAGGNIEDGENSASVVENAAIELTPEGIFVNGENVIGRIRSQRISTLSSRVAVHAPVRKALLALQRSFREKNSLVAEGRTSPAKTAISDRYEELLLKGSKVSYEQVLKDQEERDRRDATRDEAPLVIPQHAVVVDTTHLDIRGVTDKVLEKIGEKLTD